MNKKITYILIGIIVVTFGIVSTIEIRDNQNQPTKEYKEKTDGAKNTKKIENNKEKQNNNTKTIKNREDQTRKEEIKNIIGGAIYDTTISLNIFQNDIKVTDVPKDEKVISVIRVLLNRKEYKEDGFYKDMIIDKENLNKRYETIFNEPLQPIDMSNIKSCPYYISEDDNSYRFGRECGSGSSSGFIDFYVGKYENNENEVNVYFAFAFIVDEYEYDEQKKTNVFKSNKIYKDQEKTQLYSTTNERIYEILDEKNWNEFTQYKVVFEKLEDGRYIFKESIKIQ